MDNYERGFISGALDTDGCIFMGTYYPDKYPRHKVSVHFNNNDILFLEHINDILQLNKNPYKMTQGNCWALAYHKNDSRKILPQLKLVLKEKKRLEAMKNLNVSSIKFNYSDYEFKAGYINAAMDCDGYINVYEDHINVGIGSISKLLVEYIQSIIDVGCIRVNNSKHLKNPVYILQMRYNEAVQALRNMKLLIKEERRLKALSWLETRGY